MAFYLSIYPYFSSYLLVVHGETVSSAGRIVQAFTFASTISQTLVALYIKRLARYKIFVVLGCWIYVIGLGLMLHFRTESSSIPTIIASQMVVGIGGGMLHLPAQSGIQASISHQEVAAATAIYLTILEIGGAVGNAISGAIWTHSMPAKLALYLPPESRAQAAAIYSNVSLAATGWSMGSPTRDAINRAYQETMSRMLGVAVCVAIPCVILSFFMENHKLDEMDQHVKGVVVGGVQEAAEHYDDEPVPGPSRTPSHSADDRDGSRSSEAGGLLTRKDW